MGDARYPVVSPHRHRAVRLRIHRENLGEKSPCNLEAEGARHIPVVDENIQPEREAAAMLPGQAISSYRVLIVVFDVSPIRRARPSQILNPRSDKGLRQSRPGSSVARHSRECRYAFQRKQRVDLPTNSTFREPGALMFVGVKRKRVRPPALQNRQRVRRPRPQKIHNCTSS